MLNPQLAVKEGHDHPPPDHLLTICKVAYTLAPEDNAAFIGHTEVALVNAVQLEL